MMVDVKRKDGSSARLRLQDFYRELVPSDAAVMPLPILNGMLQMGTSQTCDFQAFRLTEGEYSTLRSELLDMGLPDTPTPEWVQDHLEWFVWKGGARCRATVEAAREVVHLRSLLDAAIATNQHANIPKLTAELFRAGARFRELEARDDGD